jgi:hypothetical protein
MSRAVPIANRVKMRVTGEIWRKAALVATKDIPHMTIARKAATRGGRLLVMEKVAAESAPDDFQQSKPVGKRRGF